MNKDLYVTMKSAPKNNNATALCPMSCHKNCAAIIGTAVIGKTNAVATGLVIWRWLALK